MTSRFEVSTPVAGALVDVRASQQVAPKRVLDGMSPTDADYPGSQSAQSQSNQSYRRTPQQRQPWCRRVQRGPSVVFSSQLNQRPVVCGEPNRQLDAVDRFAMSQSCGSRNTIAQRR